MPCGMVGNQKTPILGDGEFHGCAVNREWQEWMRRRRRRLQGSPAMITATARKGIRNESVGRCRETLETRGGGNGLCGRASVVRERWPAPYGY